MKVAVVGAGISGLSAARALDNQHEVTIFEKEDRLGGHTCTVEVDHYGETIPVDCGFIVYNRKTYPLLTQLFRELGVRSKATHMEFSVSLDDGEFQWAVGSLNAMFAQRKHLLNPKFYMMLLSILRFFRVTNADLSDGKVGEGSLGDYLKRNRFSDYFAYRFLVPMCRSIWSSSVEQVFDYPAKIILSFLYEHGLLSVKQPIWLTLVGGSKTYVEAMMKSFNGRVFTGCGVTRVQPQDGKVLLTEEKGKRHEFDRVILACHAPAALAMLNYPSEREASVLSRFHYAQNEVVLHGDSSFMPKNRRTWSSWNYHGSNDPKHNGDPVELTYWMNKIQLIPEEYPFFVTLNPSRDPSDGLEFARFQFEHPQFDQQAVNAQRELAEIQGLNNVWFCGAYTRYGFHEDGHSSGLDVARLLIEKAG